MNQEIEKDQEEEKVARIEEEFHDGLDFINKFNPSVTFYGSARIKEDNKYYSRVKNLASRISKELHYAVISGGGPSMMEAANRGAYEAGGKSVGLTIELPHEQCTNKYVTDEIPFNFFFARQSIMSYATEACIFCPGGFGTLSELFEVLTLKQTKKIGRVPIILYGKSFWKPIEKLIRKLLLKKFQTISPKDLTLYVMTDSEDEVLEIIKRSKIRDGEDALI